MTMLLHVEDDPTLQDLVREVVERKLPQIHFIQVAGIAAGLSILEREKPTVILLDQNLIDGNGLDFLKAAREPPYRCTAPVILCAGNATPEIPSEWTHLGVTASLPKPFRPSALVEILKPYSAE